METSEPLGEAEGESLTWRDPRAVGTGNNAAGAALQEMWGPLEKVRILHIFLLFLQNPALEGCGVLGCLFFVGFFFCRSLRFLCQCGTFRM